MRPGASPQSRRYVYTGPGVHWSLTPRDPGDPLLEIGYRNENRIRKFKPVSTKKRHHQVEVEVLHLFRCFTHTHTCKELSLRILLGTFGNLFLGTLGDLAWEPLGTSSSEPLGTRLGNLAWEPVLGTLFGNLAWEPALGNL